MVVSSGTVLYNDPFYSSSHFHQPVTHPRLLIHLQQILSWDQSPTQKRCWWAYAQSCARTGRQCGESGFHSLAPLRGLDRGSYPVGEGGPCSGPFPSAHNTVACTYLDCLYKRCCFPAPFEHDTSRWQCCTLPPWKFIQRLYGRIVEAGPKRAKGDL